MHTDEHRLGLMEKLLDGVEVEWKTLGEVAEILNGFAFKSSNYSPNGIRVVRISDVQKGKMSDKDLKFYPIETKEEIQRYLLKANDLVMSLTGNCGRVAMLSESDLPAALNQRVACIRAKKDQVITRYLFHFFDQISFENDAMSNATGGGQKNMRTRWLASYQIPIPPLHVQAEIVRVLDAFTAMTADLTAELTAELAMRKKQYNYYRDQLLSFEEEGTTKDTKSTKVEWKRLGDLVNTVTAPSKAKKADYCETGKIPIIDQGASYLAGYINEGFEPVASGEYVIFGDHSEHIKYVDFSFVQGADGLKILRPMSDVAKYIYYALQNFYQKELNYKRHWSKAKETLIPIPPLEKQKEIVAILDKFDTLVHSISEGLPREIELRQKQYEYYRDLLLSFPKPEGKA